MLKLKPLVFRRCVYVLKAVELTYSGDRAVPRITQFNILPKKQNVEKVIKIRTGCMADEAGKKPWQGCKVFLGTCVSLFCITSKRRIQNETMKRVVQKQNPERTERFK